MDPEKRNTDEKKCAIKSALLDTQNMCTETLNTVNNLILSELQANDLQKVLEKLQKMYDSMAIRIETFKDNLDIKSDILISRKILLNKSRSTDQNDNVCASLHEDLDLPTDVKMDNGVETESFDFDDPELPPSVNENAEQNLDSNNESDGTGEINGVLFDNLVMALKRVTDNNEIYDDAIRSPHAEEALKDLETSSDTSDFDIDSGTLSDDEFSFSSNDAEHDKIENEAEIRNDMLQSHCKINLARLEDMEDFEIERMCELNRISKRKLINNVNLPNAKKKKLAPISSSSSSESDDSDSDMESDNSSDATLSDLPDANLEQSEDDFFGNSDYENEQADMVCCLTSAEEDSFDIEDNFSDDESKKTVKKTDKERENDVKPSVVEDPIETSMRKRFASPSPDLGSDEDEVRTLSSDNDSDVEFIMEGSFEESTKGRRNIREIISDENLTIETKEARKREDQRIQRLEEITKTRGEAVSQLDDDNQLVLDINPVTKQPLIVVKRNLVKKMKPHQRAGVQFMWDVCYESVKTLQSSPGTGCILAHSMGLGKTLQVIALVITLFNYAQTKTKHVLIVSPLSVVQNWNNEFKSAFDLIDNQVNFNVFYVEKLTVKKKIDMIQKWRDVSGVLIMGYEAFVSLNDEKQCEKLNEYQLRKIKEALFNPGPDLIVCDEGHVLKNGQTYRTQALMKVKSRRRIVLTGTPLQNNLKEYYYMVQFVKPNLLGTFEEYRNSFVNPITNGQYFDSTPQDIKVMKQRTHVLTKLLKNTIQRVESKVLESYLPKIYDYSIFLTMDPFQEELYKKYIGFARNTIKATSNIKSGFLSHFQVTKMITLHPWLLQHYLTKKESTGEKNLVQLPDQDKDWYKTIPDCPQDFYELTKYGTKVDLILQIIDETIRCGDKILIFSASLFELDCIEHFLKKYGTKLSNYWEYNYNYVRIDSNVSPDKRSDICAKFNDMGNKDLRVFLLSHRVGGMGLNITAANRVILIGANFNPSHDTQSIYRVYRFGQTKTCYVYRIITIGTMEEKIYKRCVVKLALAGTVVDKKHIARHFNPTDLEELYMYNFSEFRTRPIPKVPFDMLFANLLNANNFIYNFLEHEALLLNRPEEELNDDEKKSAWEEFNKINAVAENAVEPITNEVIMKQWNTLNIPNKLATLSNSSNNKSNAVPSTSKSNVVKNLPAGNNYIPLAKDNVVRQNNYLRPGPSVPPIRLSKPSKTNVLSSSMSNQSNIDQRWSSTQNSTTQRSSSTTMQKSLQRPSILSPTALAALQSAVQRRPSQSSSERTLPNVKNNLASKQTGQSNTQRPQTGQNNSQRPQTAQNNMQRPQTGQNNTQRPKTTENYTQRPQTAQNNTQRPQTGQNNTQRPQTAQNNAQRPQTAQNNTQRPQTGQNNTQRSQTGQNNTQRPQTGQNNTQRPQSGQNPSHRTYSSSSSTSNQNGLKKSNELSADLTKKSVNNTKEPFNYYLNK